MDLTLFLGCKYGRLTIIEILPSKKTNNGVRNVTRHYVKCICDCGNTHDSVMLSNLKKGNTNSCGCLYKESRIGCGLRHGEARKTKEYSIWSSMLGRSRNPNNKKYPLYGGRGISVCERWQHSYQNFLEDMGRCPVDKSSIDRIDSNGNYEPSNCRWANPKEQARNLRTNRILEYKGVKLCGAEWIEKIGIPRGTFYSKLNTQKKTLAQIIEEW